MLNSLSGLGEDRLRYYLQRIREIARLQEENAALLQVDGLITELFNEPLEGDPGADVADQRQRARDILDMLSRELDRLDRSVNDGGARAVWDAERLLDRFERVQPLIDPEIAEEMPGELEALNTGLETLMQQAEANRYRPVIKGSQTRPIHNASVARSMIAELNEARHKLSEDGLLTPEIERAISQGLERAATYRARKKYMAFKVASAGGSDTKAERLLAEAEELLRQDWSEAFPEQPPPPIDSMAEQG